MAIAVGGVTATIHSCSDTEVELVVPGFSPGAYPVVLTTSVSASNALTFTVTPEPIMGVAGRWYPPRPSWRQLRGPHQRRAQDQERCVMLP